jgi:nucleoside-diphosphate-sugar epimerase
MKKVLITGGAGYVGSVLVDKLLNSGYEVTVLDNLMYNQTSLIYYSYNKNFNFIYGDVRDINLLEKLVPTFNVIIPLAAIVGFPACDKDRELATAVNYTQVKNICDLVRGTNIKVIYPNTNSGYGIAENGECTEESPLNPISHYGITKVNAEREVLSVNGISLRLATVFGSSPRMRMDLLVNEFVYKALTDKYITIFEKNFRRNYIHIRDVSKTFQYMIENYEKFQGESFNVGLSTSNLTKDQLVEKIKEFVPDLVITYSDFYQDPDKRDYLVLNTKIESTGWLPDWSLDDGIVELIKTYTILIQDLSSKYRNGFPFGYGIRM